MRKYQTRDVQPTVSKADSFTSERRVPSILNSAHRGVDTPSSPDLAGAMRSRMMAHFGGDFINQRAEDEADRIGAQFSHAGSPGELKTQMGAALGADFSAVRFHMGPDAAAMAEASDADAFASGRDIYMGAGGFDASIAAHEMVHTA